MEREVIWIPVNKCYILISNSSLSNFWFPISLIFPAENVTSMYTHVHKVILPTTEVAAK